MANIAKDIPAGNKLDKEMIKKWNSVLQQLIETRSGPFEVDAAVCEEFIFDLAGLLKHQLGVSDDLIYPTIRVNGYNCSQNYMGNQNQFYLLDSSLSGLYRSLFARKVVAK